MEKDMEILADLAKEQTPEGFAAAALLGFLALAYEKDPDKCAKMAADVVACSAAAEKAAAESSPQKK